MTYKDHTARLKTFETPDGTIRYCDEGQGDVLLLMHGVPSSSWMYRDVIDGLVGKGFRVIAPDMLGFGASDKPRVYELYDFDKQADRILNLMESLGIKEWKQVLHDMGGIVTWEMIAKSPKSISRLVVLNTIIYNEHFHPPGTFSRKNFLHRWMFGLYQSPIIGSMMVNSTLKSGTNKHKWTKAEKMGYWKPFRKGAKALVHFFTHLGYIKENLGRYSKILIDSGIPVATLWGEGDPFLGVDHTKQLKKDLNLSDENVVVLKGKKHFIAEEATDEVVDFIVSKMK